MKYPKKVQPYADALTKYAENDSLNLFNILHMYPGKLSYKSGYYDSRFFELVGYNTKEMQFKKLGNHDGLEFGGDAPVPDFVRIFVDGSTLIKFQEMVEVNATSGNAYVYSR